MNAQRLSELFVGLIIGLVATVASASSVTVATWGGSGGSGTDPYGQGWVWANNSSAASTGPNASWGIPGLYNGSLSWAGPWITDFHVQFFGLPQGVSIFDGLTPPALGDSTIFRETGQLTWDRDVTGPDTVSFYHPTGDSCYLSPSATCSLYPGELFYVNVVFDGRIPDFSGVSFEARLTQSSVPEPTTLALLGLGLAGLAASRRRKQ